MNSLDDLELELRKLPGVKAAGFDEREDVLLVQLHVGDRVDSPEHPGSDRGVAHRRPSRRRARRGRDRALADDPGARPSSRPPPVIDVATDDTAVTTQPDVAAEPAAEPAPDRRSRRPSRRRPDGPPRARLLAVLAFPDTDELEVHLILDGRRTIGRAVSSDGLVGAVEATLAAVREIGAPFEPTPLWARAIESDEDERVGRGGRARERRRRRPDRLRHGRGREPDRRRGAIDARRAEPPSRAGSAERD